MDRNWAENGSAPSTTQDEVVPLANVDDLAKILKVSTRTVWRLVSAGRLPDRYVLAKVLPAGE